MRKHTTVRVKPTLPKQMQIWKPYIGRHWRLSRSCAFLRKDIGWFLRYVEYFWANLEICSTVAHSKHWNRPFAKIRKINAPGDPAFTSQKPPLGRMPRQVTWYPLFLVPCSLFLFLGLRCVTGFFQMVYRASDSLEVSNGGERSRDLPARFWSIGNRSIRDGRLEFNLVLSCSVVHAGTAP